MRRNEIYKIESEFLAVHVDHHVVGMRTGKNRVACPNLDFDFCLLLFHNKPRFLEPACGFKKIYTLIMKEWQPKSMLKDFIKQEAFKLGFATSGITTADPLDELDHLNEAICSGRIADMKYLARNPECRCNPASLLIGAKSVICCALSYGENGIGGGAVGSKNRARFARGADYHGVVGDKLETLWNSVATKFPEARCKICVDTNPIVEKALSERAGVGFIGKHTILINKDIGSWFVLGLIVTDIDLIPDAPAQPLCGECSACIDACPSKALCDQYTLDAGKCISYLTIEGQKKSSTDQYGCDICQEACPFNFQAPRCA